MNRFVNRFLLLPETPSRGTGAAGARQASGQCQAGASVGLSRRRLVGGLVLGATGLTVRRNDIAGSQNGLIVTGTSTGTSFTANLITATTGSGVATSFYSVTGATLDDNSTEPFFRSGFGLYVTGDNSGTVVRRNVFNNNVVGVYLNAATNIVLGTNGTPADGNTISNSSFAGLQAAGACTNSFVYDTTWASNAQNVFSTATGLTISPAAP